VHPHPKDFNMDNCHRSSAILAALLLAAPLLATACSPTGAVTVGDNLNAALPPNALPTFNADGSYQIYAKAEVEDHFSNQQAIFRNSSRNSFSCVDARGVLAVRVACKPHSGHMHVNALLIFTHACKFLTTLHHHCRISELLVAIWARSLRLSWPTSSCCECN
jgi:hypothetical protein